MATITKSQQDISIQTIRNTHIRIDLLNFDYQVVDSLEGSVINGNVSIDATADIRRTCNISLVITDSSFTPQSGGKIWLDKYIQIYVGVDEIKTNQIIWNNMGIYLINSPSYSYDASTNTLSFQGLDLMSKLTGARNGYLTGTTYSIPQGSNVREVIIDILTENNFNKYIVSECLNTNNTIQNVPYNIELDMGSTWYDMLVKLRDILPNYQIYFDVDGVFHYETIPFSENDPIIVTDEIWKQNVLSEQVSVDFESVKNVIEVYGATHDLEHFASAVSFSSPTITLTIGSISSLLDGTIVGFQYTTDISYSGGLQLKINSGGTAYPIVSSKNQTVTSLSSNTTWCFQYQESNNNWLFLGHLQAQAIVKDTNVNSPFYIENPAGEIKIVLFGGEYEDIQSDDLAQERAYFELYTRCRLNDKLVLTCVPIYWLDVNTRISYTPLGQNATNNYIIQNVTIDLSPSGTMNVNLNKFYNYYPPQ